MIRKAVVAAVIERDGLIFVAQRHSGVHRGKWEFPGGKVEAGETPEGALVREIDEEFGVEIAVGEQFAEVEFSVKDRQYLLLVYLARHVRGEYCPVDHCRIDWLQLSMLPSLDFAPADIPVAALLASSDHNGRIPVKLYAND